MVDCKFADRDKQTEDQELIDSKTGKARLVPGAVKCWKLTNASGFVCSVTTSSCAKCDARIPIGMAETGVPIELSKTLAPILKQSLRARIMAGDCPRFQAPNPVNLDAAFSKFEQRATKEECVSLLAEAHRYQSRIGEAEGGDPVEVVAEKLATVADKHGLSAEFAAVVETYNRLPGG